MLKITTLFRRLACYCLLPVFCFAEGIDVVFLGVLGNDAPAIEKTFDSHMRDALSVNPEFNLLDYLASQQLRHKINFDDYPTVSRKLVESLRQYSSDSTIFIWATIKDRSIKPVRRLLVKAAAHGELTLSLNIYSLRYKDYAFIGDVRSSAEKPEGFIFFYPLETGVHISALDQDEITGQLVSSVAFRSANLVSQIIKSEQAKNSVGTDTNTIQKYKAASISEMFNVPSVEAANVQRSRKSALKTEPPAQTPSTNPVSPAKSSSAPAATPLAPAPAASANGNQGQKTPNQTSPENKGVSEKASEKPDSTKAK